MEVAIAGALAEADGVDSGGGVTVVGIAGVVMATAVVIVAVVVVVIVVGMTEGGDAAGILLCQTQTPRASVEGRGRELTLGLGAVEACNGNVCVGERQSKLEARAARGKEGIVMSLVERIRV